MIILGYPEDTGNYYCADGGEAVEITRAGFIPLYKDDAGCLYFKRTKKLLKFLNKIDEEF